jgi:hypothetical protein
MGNIACVTSAAMAILPVARFFLVVVIAVLCVLGPGGYLNGLADGMPAQATESTQALNAAAAQCVHTMGDGTSMQMADCNR